MEQDSPPGVDTSLAAHAFGELRAEVSLLRRAVERLTDERINQPDYAPSLEAISKRLEDVCSLTAQFSEKPSLRLTPEIIGRQIAEAATTARENDQQMLKRSAADMDAAASRIDAALARARSAAEQNRELLHNRVAFAVAGMVAFAILPGAIARSLPVSWAVPERIAARMLGRDMWGAGQQMMAKANPERWQQIVAREQQTQERGKGGDHYTLKNQLHCKPASKSESGRSLIPGGASATGGKPKSSLPRYARR